MQIRNFTSRRLMAVTKLPFRAFIALAVAMSATACMTSMDEDISLNPSVENDSIYADSYLKHTNQYEVIENFETKYVISATHLTSDFRQAVATRHKKVFEDPAPILSEASSKTGFFVSLYVANDEQEDLRNQNLWNISLKEGQSSKGPILVKKLSKKERWKNYFPAINLWTQEYLILFDSPSTGSANQQLLDQEKKILLISNADAKVKMSW